MSAAAPIARPVKDPEPPRIQAPQLLDFARTAALEQRLQALESAQPQKPVEPVIEPTEPSAPEPPSAREIEEQHEARIQAHQAERLDTNWARTTSSALLADFKHLEGTNITVAGVECRSTTCSVKLEWPSREQALVEWRRALMQPTRANCGREIVVPERAAGITGPIQATLLLDCATWVQAGSPMLSEDELPQLAH